MLKKHKQTLKEKLQSSAPAEPVQTAPKPKKGRPIKTTPTPENE